MISEIGINLFQSELNKFLATKSIKLPYNLLTRKNQVFFFNIFITKSNASHIIIEKYMDMFGKLQYNAESCNTIFNLIFTFFKNNQH
jgi:hypothetical protein